MSQLNITIIGLGLIGGSLGLSLKDGLGNDIILTGWDIDHNVMQAALKIKAVERITDNIDTAVENADMIFLCTPVLQMLSIVERITPFLKKGSIITDVGSTKRLVFEKIIQQLPEGVDYVGGHPMAGSEKSGINAADKYLFKNKYYILVGGQQTKFDAVVKVKEVISLTGAIITTMDVEKHDLYAAMASHIPHVAAAALVNLLENLGEPDGFKLAGGGFRDTTRIAGADADMWADICVSNSDALVNGLVKLQKLLGEVICATRDSNRQALYDFFSKAKQRRENILTSLLVSN